MKNLIILLSLFIPIISFAEKIAIIGGGMAGVATAAFLKNTNHEIHLFEKEKKLGGNARTVVLKGAQNQEVNVDIGPQYFAKTGWELYIDFLRYFKLYKKKNIYKFNVGFTLFKPEQRLPEITLPDLSLPGLEWLLEKPDALFRLLSMMGFFNEITQFHNNPQKENIPLEEFLKTVSIEEEFKEDIILPILAASFTLSMDTIRGASAIFVGGLLHTEGMIPSSEFMVLKLGMQYYIEEIARKVQEKSKNFNIHLSSPVQNVSKNFDGSLKVTFDNGDEKNFDKVIFAVHPYIASQILKDWTSFNGVWENFTYVDTRVVIHNDSSYLHPIYRSFYNLKFKDNGEYNMAMRLKDISPEYGNLIKSWGLNEEEYQDLKGKGRLLAEEHFKHPYITPKFIEANLDLKRLAKEQGNIFFAGGWIMNWETQHTAILSGFEVAKEIDPNLGAYWKKKLPYLKNPK